MDELTDKQAYWVMHLFLNDFWQHNKSEYTDDLPGMLGAMSLLVDGRPADDAQWEYWLESIPGTLMTEQEAFEFMQRFLDQYRQLGEKDREISRLLEFLQSSPDTVVNWNKFVGAIKQRRDPLTPPDDVYLRLVRK